MTHLFVFMKSIVSRTVMNIGTFNLSFLLLITVLFQNTEVFSQQLVYTELELPTCLYSPITMETQSVRMSDLIYSSLYAYDFRGEITPSLASQPFPESFSDRYEIRIRKGLRWPLCGKEITAEDIKFCYDLVIDEETELMQKEYSVIESVSFDHADPYSIEFKLKNTVTFPQQIFTLPIIPKNNGYEENYIHCTCGLLDRPEGCGPYYIDEWNQNVQEINLVYNKNFHGKRPQISAIKLKAIPDKNTALRALLHGSINFYPDLSPSHYNHLDRITSWRSRITSYNSQNIECFALNCVRRDLMKKQFRQALSYAMDIESLIWTLFPGSKQISGPYSLSSPYYNHDIEPLKHDIKKAKELLKRMNYNWNADGLLTYNGAPLEKLIIIEPPANEQAVHFACQHVQEKLNEIGIESEIKAMSDQKAWFQRIFIDRDFDIAFIIWKFYAYTDVSPLFGSEYMGKGSSNFVQFVDPKLDDLFEMFHTSGKMDQKISIGKRIHAHLHETSPYIYGWERPSYAAWGEELDNVILTTSVFSLIHLWQYNPAP